MPHHFPRFRRVLAPSLLWASTAAWAQPAAGAVLVRADEPLPTRFVLCQREVGGQEGDRQKLLRACLARRLEGERIVERNCRRQAGSVGGAAARQQAQRDCERLALAVPANELPKAPPRAPKPVLTVDTGGGGAVPAAAAPAAPKPAAGEF